MEERTEHTLNPWISIWTQPRATIQQIVDTDPKRLVLVLAALAGVVEILGSASSDHMGDEVNLAIIIILAIIIGPIAGIIGLYIVGALIHWTGKWLGGKSPSEHIRAAFAWSYVPTVQSLILWIPALFLFGQELFTTERPTIEASHYLKSAFLGLGFIEIIITLWSIVILLKCLGQVQGFSAWKALGNFLLAVMVIAVPIFVVMMVIVAFA